MYLALKYSGNRFFLYRYGSVVSLGTAVMYTLHEWNVPFEIHNTSHKKNNNHKTPTTIETTVFLMFCCDGGVWEMLSRCDYWARLIAKQQSPPKSPRIFVISLFRPLDSTWCCLFFVCGTNKKNTVSFSLIIINKCALVLMQCSCSLSGWYWIYLHC